MLAKLVRCSALITFAAALLAANIAMTEDAPKCERTIAALESGNEPVRIVCFGDSLTGVYYHTGGRRAYADMLGIALGRTYPKAKIEMHNAGISGDTTTGALKRIDKDVLAHKPQLVTVMFGMNDMVGNDLDGYRKRLSEIIARCRKAGAEVMLCTSNSVKPSGGRPPARLEQFMQALRDVGKADGVPVADCYRAFEAARAADSTEWTLLLSDEIHPNMDGDKLLAETILEAISGRKTSLKDVTPLQPFIPRTFKLLKEKKPIKVHAMPPFDQLIGPALQKIDPSAKVEVTKWDVDEMTIAEVEASAKPVRQIKPDLVIVSVPVSSLNGEAFHRSFSWTLNYSLSFGLQEWDCIAIPPSVANPDLPADKQSWDQLVRRLIRAQDLSGVERAEKDRRPTSELLDEWLQGQVKSSVTSQ